jgi:hypothetical protein
MFKIKKRADKPKATVLYNIIEDYSEFDAPGNVTACAMTLPEDVAAHAKILAESYDVPFDIMTTLLAEGGTYVYPHEGGILTRGLFACVLEGGDAIPKQTFVLDVMCDAVCRGGAGELRPFPVAARRGAARVL